MMLFMSITVLSFIAFHSGELIKPFFRWVYKASSTERSLLRLKGDLKTAQSKMSMVDDFAKYSRIQRRLNTIDQELSELQNERLRNNFIVRMVCTYGIRLILGVVLLCLSIYYRSTPLLHLNEEFDLFPFSYIISYPNSRQNVVSVPFWIMCCTTMGSLIKIGD